MAGAPESPNITPWVHKGFDKALLRETNGEWALNKSGYSGEDFGKVGWLGIIHIGSIYGMFTCIFTIRINQMWVNIPYMDTLSLSQAPSDLDTYYGQ